MKEYAKPLLMGLSVGVGLAVAVGLWEMIETARSVTRLNERDWSDLKEIVRGYQRSDDVTMHKGTTTVNGRCSTIDISNMYGD